MGDLKGRGRRDEIREVKHRVEDELLDQPGVVGVDINEKITRGRPSGWLSIVVSVRRKLPLDEVPRGQVIPGRIDGIPTDVVEEDTVLHRLLLDEAQAPGAAAEVSTTIVGGLSIGPGRAMWLAPPEVPEAGEYVTVGTLGALVNDRCGHVMGLTNFHVACVDDAWSVGDAMVHPARVDGGRPRVDVFGTLARAALSGSVDGAVVQLAAGKAYEATIVGVGPVRGSATAELGTSVRKYGRSTGLTGGLIVSVDATLALDYGDGIGRRVLRDQIRVQGGSLHSAGHQLFNGHRPAGGSHHWFGGSGRSGGTPFGDHGDSGAAVVDCRNQVVGLYIGGTTTGEYAFANKIKAVLDALDVELCLTADLN